MAVINCDRSANKKFTLGKPWKKVKYVNVLCACFRVSLAFRYSRADCSYNVKEVLNLFNVSAAATFTIFPPFQSKLRSYLAFLASSQGTPGDGLDPHAATLGKAKSQTEP